MNAIPNVMPNVLTNVFNNVNPGVFGGLGPELMLDWDMEQTGPNLVTNGDFKLWTADNPDSWVVAETPPNSEITQVGNACRMVSDGTLASVLQSVLTATDVYDLDLDILDVTAGKLVFAANSTITDWDTVGHKSITFTADGANAQFKRGLTPDMTFTDVCIGLSKSTTWAWTDGNSAVLTKESDGGTGQVIQVAYNSVTDPFAVQAVLTVGKKYRFILEYSGDGTAIPQAIIGGTTFIGASSTSMQTIKGTITATATTVNLRAATAIAGFCQFDNVSIKEIL